MKIKNFILSNLIIIIYFVLSFLIELTGALITDGGFYIKDPRYILTIVGIVSLILLLITNQKARLIVASGFLLVQAIFNILFKLLFDMSGQWFDYSMLLLRNDAMGIIESVPISFWFSYFLLLILGLFVVFGLRLTRRIKKYDITYTHKQKIIKNSVIGGLIAVLLGLNILTGFLINGGYKDKYKDILYSTSSSKYNQYGMTFNFLNEIYGGTVFNTVETKTDSEMAEFIYKDIYNGSDDIFGISKGNNVVSILGETFEWLSFMPNGYKFGNGEELVFPNGMKFTEEKCRELFPNLWNFYDNSYVMTNYHAREKTDISENYSILGSYPMGTYINYDYYENTLPQSMPNMLRNAYKDNFTSQYFHNGNESFYNRYQSVYGLGFDEFYASEQMEEFGYTNYMEDGERNLDSEMIEVCKDKMFPTDKKFYTEITTITMHGMYSKKRNNLEALGYYKILADNGLDIDSPDITEEEFVFISYLACAMETDKAIGLVLSELEKRNLLDCTTIVLFGDHQGYYEGLSNYVKDISSESQALEDNYNYMDLYRVPMMIYDTKLFNYVTNNGTNLNARFNNKFSSSCDIVPTLLDLLGIKYYSNIYYGNSVFSNTESLVYSRGYGYFLDNYSYFYNINSFSYINPIVKEKFGSIEAYKDSLKARGDILIEKIRYVDIAFKMDYFGTTTNYLKYYENINKINS
ncbi:MAG: LTA synthase family protein [Anaeroplasmataceae bacterium]